ncbi:MAG: hypothetical protein KDE59_10755 [Anaerolineales bacterium]|nr:hypothetical protein [Anaerolineales bacterium]
MELDRDKLQREIHALYKREHEELGEAGTLRQLEEARKWDFSGTLAAGGVVVFPHAGVHDCGHQIAAAVHAALDSGADKVLVISVLHAFTQEMQDARVRVANGGDPADEIFWGIQGPGIDGPRQEWQGDHALYSWRHFWAAETKRRGIKGPEVIERYPYLAGGHPENLPGYADIAKIAEDAVIVSTADAFHHGIGYGDPPDKAYEPNAEGLAYAHKRLMEGVHILEKGDYWGYNQHCVEAKSDARDAGQLFRHLRGPMKGTIHDLVYTDSTELYNQPAPTWVAGTLFEWQLTG